MSPAGDIIGPHVRRFSVVTAGEGRDGHVPAAWVGGGGRVYYNSKVHSEVPTTKNYPPWNVNRRKIRNLTLQQSGSRRV